MQDVELSKHENNCIQLVFKGCFCFFANLSSDWPLLFGVFRFNSYFLRHSFCNVVVFFTFVQCRGFSLSFDLLISSSEMIFIRLC